MSDWTKPIFTTGMAAHIIDVQPKTLINYENWGLFIPDRSHTGRRLYSRSDIYEILAIRHLLESRKLTINGIKFVLELINAGIEQGVDLRDTILTEEIKLEIEGRIP
jgi:DNA-binding transcriptional MerR regulator